MRMPRSIMRKFGNLTFLRPGLRLLVVFFFRPLEREDDEDFSINLRGFRFDGNFRNALDHVVYYLGAYEPDTLYLLETLTGRINDCISFDVGCNTGQHALVMSKNSKKLYAFEPLARVRMKAEQRAMANNIDNITFLPFGLGLRTTEIQYYLDAESQNDGTGSFFENYNPLSKPYAILQVENGDAWVKAAKITQVDVIKIDTEGFEHYVISGLSDIINKSKPFIIFERSPISASGFSEMGGLKRILHFDFDIYKVLGYKRVLRVFQTRSLNLVPVESGAECTRDVTHCNLFLVPKERRVLIADMIMQIR